MKRNRLELVRQLLAVRPYISLHELEEEFPEVSAMTLRRDIEFLEREGEAIKVRGGVRSMKFITTTMEDSFSARLAENTEAKEKISLAAVPFLEPGRSIFMDSGTTMLRLAMQIPNERFSITTTDPNVALELVRVPRLMVNLVGGMLNRDNLSLSGAQAMKYLSDINIDIALITPSGLSPDNGFTGGNYTECELKKFVVEKARFVIVLVDHSKIDKNLPYTFSTFDQADVVITDGSLPEKVTRQAEDGNVRIIYV